MYYKMFVLSVFTAIVSMLWLVQFFSNEPGAPIIQFVNIWFIIMWSLLCLTYVYTRFKSYLGNSSLRQKLLS